MSEYWSNWRGTTYKTRKKKTIPTVTGHNRIRQTELDHGLWEVFASLFNVVLDAQEQRRLPLVELAELVILEQLVREEFLVALLDGLDQVHQKLVLPGGSKCRVNVSVALESTVGSDKILDIVNHVSIVLFSVSACWIVHARWPPDGRFLPWGSSPWPTTSLGCC